MEYHERPAKKARTTDNVEDVKPALPPDVWAAVMEFLPLSTAVSLSRTCRAIYYEATPLVKTLSIQKATEMNNGVSRRFVGVRDVLIFSLMSSIFVSDDDDDDDDDESDSGSDDGGIYLRSIDFETSARAATFLYGFTKLKRVVFGGIVKNINDESDGHLVTHTNIAFKNIIPEESCIQMSSLIDSLSAAFRCDALPPNLEVKGLGCLEGEPECQVCIRACQSYPIRSVANFECQGSSVDMISRDRCHDLNLDVCLRKEKIERIVEQRGGRELLYSNDRLLSLLSRGKCRPYRCTSTSSGYTLNIIDYSELQLEEFSRIIKQLDKSTLKSTEIVQAILESSSIQTPSPKHAFILSEESRNHLEASGFPVTIGNLELCRRTVLELLSDSDIIEQDNFLRQECLSILIQSVRSNEVTSHPDIIESDFLCSSQWDATTKEKSVHILAAVLLGGTTNGYGCEHIMKRERAAMIGSLVVGKPTPPLAKLIETSTIRFVVSSLKDVANPHFGSISFCIVCEIIKHENTDLTKTIFKAGVVPNLMVYLGEASQDKHARLVLFTRAISAMLVIARTCSAYLWAVFGSGIIQMMISFCSDIDKRDPLRQELISFIHAMVFDTEELDLMMLHEIINFGCMPSLIASLAHNMVVQKALDILSAILGNIQSEHVVHEVVEAGAIQSLVDLIWGNADFDEDEIAEKSIIALEIIVNTSEANRVKVLETQTDLFDCLCRGLKNESYLGLWEHFLSLMYSLAREGKSRRYLVDKIISHTLIPVMVEVIVYWAMPVLCLLLEEHEFLVREVVGAGIISNVVHCVRRGLMIDPALRILCLILEKLDKYFVNEATNLGAIPVLTTFIQTYNGSTDAPNMAIRALSYICQLSIFNRDEVLKTGMLDLVSTQLKTDSTPMGEKQLYLFFIYSMSIPGKNVALVKKISDLELIPVLLEFAHADEEKKIIQVYSICILTVIIKENETDSTLDAMIRAGTIPVLVDFLGYDCVDDQSTLIVENALFALLMIVQQSCYRALVFQSGVMSHLRCGLRAKSTYVRKGWIILIDVLIAHIGSKKGLRAFADSGIVEVLIDSMIEEKDQSIKLSARPILEKVKPQLIEKEKARTVLLQERRSSLMVDNWQNEVQLWASQQESLETALSLNVLAGTASTDNIQSIKKELEEVSSRLIQAQDVLKDLSNDTKKVAPQDNSCPQHHVAELPSFIDDLDYELQLSKRRIQELSSPFYANESKHAKKRAGQ